MTTPLKSRRSAWGPAGLLAGLWLPASSGPPREGERRVIGGHHEVPSSKESRQNEFGIWVFYDEARPRCGSRKTVCLGAGQDVFSGNCASVQAQPAVYYVEASSTVYVFVGPSAPAARA